MSDELTVAVNSPDAGPGRQECSPARKPSERSMTKPPEKIDPASAFGRLSLKRRAFVKHYLEHFNASRAAKEAGYTAKNLRTSGCELLADPNIAAAVYELLDRQGITPERIKAGFADIAFASDLADVEEVLKGGSLKELRAAGVPTHWIRKLKVTPRVVFVGVGESRKPMKLQEITVELHDRMHALDSLAKCLGMFLDRADLTSAGHQINAGINMIGLSDATKRIVLKELGGPPMDSDYTTTGNPA